MAYMNIFITFQAYGNVTMDCTIVGFYAQAKVQLQILRYNLENLVEASNGRDTKDFQKTEYINYRDVGNKTFKQSVQERLVLCVEHHQKIRW